MYRLTTQCLVLKDPASIGDRDLNNLLLSMLILMILVGVGGALVEKTLEGSPGYRDMPYVRTVNIAIYRLYNSSGHVIVVINYGREDIVIERILCIDPVSRETVYFSTIETRVERGSLYITVLNISVPDPVCIAVGDGWERVF